MSTAMRKNTSFHLLQLSTRGGWAIKKIQYKVIILTKFHGDWAKIMDFLLIMNYLAVLYFLLSMLKVRF